MYTYDCKIKKVYDGDTVHADIDLGFKLWLVDKEIRINGIDTPELRTKNLLEKQAGYAVKVFVNSLVKEAKTIRIKSEKLDKYGRILGDVIIDGTYLSEILIAKGYALSYDGGTKTQFTEAMLQKIINEATPQKEAIK